MKDKMFLLKIIILAMILSLPAACSEQTEEEQKLSPHLQKMYQQLNGFVEEIYRVHEKRLEKREYYTTEKIGGYGGMTNNLEFYNEINYYDSKTRKLLSTIKWERENPENIHMIDLYIYDEKGRVKRSYSASYLPSRRVSPLETVVTLHFYSNGTHSLREFDAQNVNIYEQCNNINDETETYFAFHYEDIPESYTELEEGVRDLYRACFSNASKTAEPYISPLIELDGVNEMSASS